MSLSQRHPFRFVEPGRVAVEGDRATLTWQAGPDSVWYREGEVPLFVLLELVGQTAEICLRRACADRIPAGARLLLGGVEQIVCAEPPPPGVPLVVAVRLEAALERLFRSSGSVQLDGRPVLTGVWLHALAP